eukprot:12520076-Prorocentrum_lima.AAC.1
MTSSLVGSEMCIRDSLSPLAARRPSPASQCPASPSQNPPEGKGYSTGNCLLYTSDAADDM